MGLDPLNTRRWNLKRMKGKTLTDLAPHEKNNREVKLISEDGMLIKAETESAYTSNDLRP